MNEVELSTEEAELLDRLITRLRAAKPGSFRTENYVFWWDGEGKGRMGAVIRNKGMELASAIYAIITQHWVGATSWVDRDGLVRVQFGQHEKSKKLTLAQATAYLAALQVNPVERI